MFGVERPRWARVHPVPGLLLPIRDDRPTAFIQSIRITVRTASIAFWKDNVMGMSAMIAFFAFLALVPLALLFLAFVGNIMGGLITPHEIRQLFHNFVPGLSQDQFLQTYWYPIRHSRTATTILGLVSLPFGTTGLHDSVDWAVNRIWRSEQNRPFWIGKLRGLAVTLWAVAFSVASLALAWIWSNGLHLAHVPSWLAGSWATAIPIFALDVSVFTALYLLTPTVRVNRTAAIFGAVVGAALWGVSKVVFGWWVSEVGTYNRIYGPLAASVIVMLWLWISAMIFLFGAELAWALQVRWAGAREPRRRHSMV